MPPPIETDLSPAAPAAAVESAVVEKRADLGRWSEVECRTNPIGCSAREPLHHHRVEPAELGIDGRLVVLHRHP